MAAATTLNNDVTALFEDAGNFAACYMVQTGSGSSTYQPVVTRFTLGQGTISSLTGTFYSDPFVIGTSKKCVKYQEVAGNYAFVLVDSSTFDVTLVKGLTAGSTYSVTTFSTTSSSTNSVTSFLTSDFHLFFYGHFTA